ncbi:twin-arginine translocation pathway signal protein [Sphingomonas trueperi]|uniref:twin-arginine translocation pathway signal protein n=1 Tax=Sphingomonas trueperi TaxID=53317 RepID=UPI00339135DB
MVRILILASLAMASSPAAQAQQLSVAEAQRPPFVPTNFAPPTLVKANGFKLVPLGPALVKIDFDAYTSSIEHLQKTFTRSTDWPHAGITDAEAMRDMESEQARFRNRQSFAYAVLTPDGRRERGCVYVSPSPIAGHDAVVRLWVTKAEYDAGFDAELYAWVQAWIGRDWPFRTVAYPGRAIAWPSWDAAIASGKRRAGE